VRSPLSEFGPPLTRREWLQLAAAGVAATSMSGWIERLAAQTANNPRRQRSCILLWMTGGPPQHETWDPKPDAPAEVRGPFGSIASSVPGVRVGELMPRTARWLDRLCVLRAVVTNNPGHVGGSYEMLTGAEHPGGKGNEAIVASRTDFPTLGAVVKHLRPSMTGVPSSVAYPQAIFNVPFYPGQDAGFLGGAWDPWRLALDWAAPTFHVPGLSLESDVVAGRLGQRRSLLDQVDHGFQRLSAGPAPARFAHQTGEAFDLLTGPKARDAFALDREAPALRDRYGRHPFGQGCLLARRLVEAGVGLVQVNWHREPNDDQPMWDCHYMMETHLKNKLMPPMDQGYTTLLEDLHQRGLLAETLVVWMGEMGRTPHLESQPQFREPGRNHWGDVFSIALAGAGVRPGLVYGASDQRGAQPKDNPVRPNDLTATIYHALGIAPESEIRDRLGRPTPLSTGRILTGLFS
jgi:hypothetical protein